MDISPKTRQAIQDKLAYSEAIRTAAAFEVALALKKAEPTQPDDSQKKKQPKETDGIRALLDSYVTLQKRIDFTEKRLECLELSKGAPSTPNLSGMPSGGHDRGSKQERDYIKTEELEEKLGRMNAQENRLRELIETLVELMKKPDEQTIIEMHYLDGIEWKTISATLYGDEDDYDEHEKRYLKRTFKVHGSALQSLAKIYAEYGNQ